MLTASLILSACGAAKHPYDATAENNGYYVTLDGVSYQLQVSRELNPFETEDSQYLSGVTTQISGSSEIWYGVFLRALNAGNRTVQTVGPLSVDITDTQGGRYQATVLPATNPYAWTAQTLGPRETEPAPDSTAYTGPTQGGLLLFRLPNTVYANRPLTLELKGQGHTATISLDL